MRVSTFGNYQSALLDLMQTQQRQLDAQQRVSTQKVATDLQGFGRGSETLTALKAAEVRLASFIDTGEAVAARLESQSLALDRTADAAEGARQAIAEALAAGRMDGLMQDLQGQFQQAQAGLNAKHQGRYLFAGARVETAPVTVDTLAELAAAVPADVFANDGLKATSRLDEATTLETGLLADDLGGPLFDIFRDIQLYHEGANGPLSGEITDTQRDWLQARLAELDAAHEGLINAGARTGSQQNRVDSILESHRSQADALEVLVGERTDADLAQAITDLELAQYAVQASAQVISQLRNSSLLNFLS